MGRNVDNLRLRYADLTRQIERLRQEQDRLNRAAERHSRLTNMGSKAMMAGSAVGTAGAGLLLAARGPIDEAKHYQNELTRIKLLGLDNAAVERAKKYATDFKAFGVSQLDKIELMRDALAVFGGDEHHAEMAMPVLTKMKFSNAANFGGSGEERTRQLQDMLKVIELRGGTKTAAEFNSEANWVQKVINSTGGRVQANEWRNVIATGGLAAKSMKAEEFYKLLEPIIQEKGGHQTGTGLMSAYQSIYQGRTTKRAANNMARLGLIDDFGRVKHDKAGQVSFIDVGAIKGSDIFRRNQLEWIEKIMLPALAKKGITEEDDIIDAIGSFVSNRKGADFLATLYLQRQQIHKSMELTEKSLGIDDTFNTTKEGAPGEEQELLAKKNDLLLEIGTQSLPLYVKFLEMASGALQKLNGFMSQNPALASAIGNGLMVLGGVFAVFGPLLIGGGGLIWGFGQFVMVGSRLMPLLSLLSGAVTVLGTALRFLALNPVGMVITAIGLLVFAGYQLYKHWDTWGPKLQQVGAMILDYLLKPINMSINAINGLTGLMNKIPGVKIDRLQTASQLLGVDKASRNAAEYNLPATIAKPAAAAPVAQSSTTNHFTINQQPGQDQRSLAREIAKQIERQNAVKSNSTMFDGVPAL